MEIRERVTRRLAWAFLFLWTNRNSKSRSSDLWWGAVYGSPMVIAGLISIRVNHRYRGVSSVSSDFTVSLSLSFFLYTSRSQGWFRVNHTKRSRSLNPRLYIIASERYFLHGATARHTLSLFISADSRLTTRVHTTSMSVRKVDGHGRCVQ